MNITISADDDLVRRARAVAQERGTSLNEVIREFLRQLVGDDDPERAADELVALFGAAKPEANAYQFRREDAYEGRG